MSHTPRTVILVVIWRIRTTLYIRPITLQERKPCRIREPKVAHQLRTPFGHIGHIVRGIHTSPWRVTQVAAYTSAPTKRRLDGNRLRLLCRASTIGISTSDGIVCVWDLTFLRCVVWSTHCNSHCVRVLRREGHDHKTRHSNSYTHATVAVDAGSSNASRIVHTISMHGLETVGGS